MALGLSWLLLGCSATVIQSGLAPGRPAPGYDQRWHPAFVFGAFTLHESYDLRQICPQGWAEIRSEPDAFTGLAGLVTLFIYSPSRITVICAALPDTGPPPLKVYPVPRQ